jgi:hypothetical protein
METCAIAFHFEWFPTVSNGFLRASFKLQAGSQRKPMPVPIALSEAVKHSVPKGQVGVVQSMGAMNPYATMRQPRGEGTRGCKLRIRENMDVTCASKVWCSGVLCVFSEGRKSFFKSVHRCNGLVRWNVKKCAFMQRLARVAQ